MMASISSTTHSVSSQLPASVCQRPSSRNNSSSRSSFPYHFRSDSAQLKKLLGLLQQKTLRSSFLSRYVVGDILGQGGYGLVAEAHDTRTHQPVAVKFVFKNKIKTQMVHDRWFGRMIPMEAYVLAQLDHPNAIRLLDFDEDRNLYYLVTELHGTPWTAPVTGHTSRDLFDCIEHHGRLSEDIARKIMAQVISCVQHMAERGFFHRDIKDENILVDENFNVKITDFGSTVYSKEKEYSKAKVDRFFGTVTYAAPEIFHQQSYVAEPAEVWALGVLLYNMLFGKAPFADKFQVLYGSFARPTAHTSPECMHLLRGMLAKSPADRMTLADVQAHRWFTPSAPPSPLLRLLQK